jgi:hypothetical protein
MEMKDFARAKPKTAVCMMVSYVEVPDQFVNGKSKAA